MEIHGDDMVAARGLEHVGHESRGDRRAALILLVLSRVREVGDDSGDAACGGGLAGVDHDEQLHQTIVDVVGAGRLQDENILVSYTLANGDAGFLVRVLEDHNLGQLDAKPANQEKKKSH